MVPIAYRHERERTAFCALCPPVSEVTAFLELLGLERDFQMDMVPASESSGLLPLPAQAHFRGPGGLSVIYLAGRDANMDGERHPDHASRWWLYTCEESPLARSVASMLTLTWSLEWKETTQPDRDAVA